MSSLRPPVLVGVPLGQCRLTYTDTTHLKLIPFKGNRLFINGAHYKVPSAGVTVDTAGLSASTLYYVYAAIIAGVMTLELSATTHATSSTYGNEIKTADETRALVGMARTDGSTLFANSVTQRFVRSWFNDAGVAGIRATTGSLAESTNTYTEINGSTDRCEFLAWANEPFTITATASPTGSADGVYAMLRLGLDGSQVGAHAIGQSAGTGWNIPLAVTYAAQLAEGYHYQSLYGKGSGGTATFGTGLSNTSHGFRSGAN